jgi:hypothetical protein
MGDRPSIEFLTAFCERFDVSADWLLTGRGPQRWTKMQPWAAQTCTMGDLCRLVGEALDAAEARAGAIEAGFQGASRRP